MANDGMVLDVDRRLELAMIELMGAYGAITNIVTVSANIVRAADLAWEPDYPSAYIDAAAIMEFGYHVGWYRGAVNLGGMTYRDDDKDGQAIQQLMGALRGFSQQSDLPDQINNTASAQAAATQIDVRDVVCDGLVFDNSDGRRREKVLPVTVLCRPSQSVTT